MGILMYPHLQIVVAQADSLSASSRNIDFIVVKVKYTWASLPRLQMPFLTNHENCKSKSKHRAKCFIISQVVRTKFYHSCLLFVNNNNNIVIVIIIIWYYFSFIPPQCFSYFSSHLYIGFHAQLITCMRTVPT